MLNKWLNALTAVIELGMQTAWEMMPAAPKANDWTALETAIKGLDGLIGAKDLPDDNTTGQIKPILATFTAAIAVAPVGGAPANVGAKSAVEQVRLKLSNTSALAWGIALIVSTIVGTYVLVVSNPGFGIINDYFACVFWGLGLPAGAAIMQQTRQSAWTALSVSSN